MKEEKVIHLYLTYTMLYSMYQTINTQVSTTMNEDLVKYKSLFERAYKKLKSCEIKSDDKVIEMYDKYYKRVYEDIHAYDHLLTSDANSHLITKQVADEFKDEFTVVNGYVKKLLDEYYPKLNSYEHSPFKNDVSGSSYDAAFFLTRHLDKILIDHRFTAKTESGQYCARHRHDRVFERLDKTLETLDDKRIKNNNIREDIVNKEIIEYSSRINKVIEEEKIKVQKQKEIEKKKKDESSRLNQGNDSKVKVNNDRKSKGERNNSTFSNNKLLHYLVLPFTYVWRGLKWLFKSIFKGLGKVKDGVANSCGDLELKDLLLIVLPTIVMISYVVFFFTGFLDKVELSSNSLHFSFFGYYFELSGLSTGWLENTDHGFFSAITLGLLQIIIIVISFVADLLIHLVMGVLGVVWFLLLLVLMMCWGYVLPIAIPIWLLIYCFKVDSDKRGFVITGLIISIVCCAFYYYAGFNLM